MTAKRTNSGIWDNHKRGAIGDFLRDRINPEAELSFVSAYFTIYAYEALKSQLDSISHLRFLFGEPRFIQSLDPDKTESKAFCIDNDGLALGNRLEQKRVARECADWLRQKADIRSITKPGFLHGNWTVYRENDERNPLKEDRLAFTVLSHTDLSRESGKSGDVDLASHSWGNYDLLVVDESHNFRNNAGGKRKDDGERSRSRYERLMQDIIRSGVKTKVLLLSATPVNTNLRDLRNQIYLITEGQDRAFEASLKIFSIAQTMQTAQSHFTRWADPEKNKDRRVARLLEALDSSFFTLLDELTIARSRKHIESYYDINRIGKFPERLKPVSLAPDIDTKGFFPTYDDLNEQISEYKLSVFNPSAYVLDEHMAQYAKDGEQIQLFNDQKTRETYLIGMMRVNFLKRLESSIESLSVHTGRCRAGVLRCEPRYGA